MNVFRIEAEKNDVENTPVRYFGSIRTGFNVDAHNSWQKLVIFHSLHHKF